jgi:signal transduction histidine kinase
LPTAKSDINSNSLRWRFDVNTFRLIGRELITDRVTAVFELIKNCYDANSTEVRLNFANVSERNQQSQITITDNGEGMSFADIRDKWMVVGTNSKRKKLYSPKPFNRRYVGEKGIGRFAVDKLGSKLKIKTKKRGEANWLSVVINWDEYERLSKAAQLTLFTDVDNHFSYEKGNINEHGTSLEITKVNEQWSLNDFERLEKELSKVVSPFFPIEPPFNIYLSSNEHPEQFSEKLIKAEDVQFASSKFQLRYDLVNQTQDVLHFNEATGKVIIKKTGAKIFGPVQVIFYYFNEAAKRKYHAAFKNDDTRIDGIKIYRDGVLTTPFAEFESHPDKKRDILGIDKRLWRDIFNRVSSREIIGIVEISKERNPGIIDATNRQDFIDREEYRQLKEFIIEQLNVISKLKIHERENSKKTASDALERADTEVKYFIEAIQEIEHEHPEIKRFLKPLKYQAKEVSVSIKHGISEQKKAEIDFARKETIYLSLMSLQDYASKLAHAVRTSLSKIKDMAAFIKNKFPNAKHENIFKEYAVLIYDEMVTLNRVVDFMLSYAGSELEFEDMHIKDVILKLFQLYTASFTSENINLSVDVKDDVILYANRRLLEDIFENLISNSVKALRGRKNKMIKCSGFIEDDTFAIIFSDNGIGIKQGDEEKIFDIYYTTTAEQGGAGIGLFIVKTRIEALKGTIELQKSEFFPDGTTFKIVLPFKR